MLMASLKDWPWRHWALKRPQAIAVIVEQQPISWQELQQQIDRLAADFQRQGVLPDLGIVLLGQNSYPLLLAYLALLQCGSRLLPLNPALPVPMLATLLPDLDITFAFSPNALPELPSLPELPPEIRILSSTLFSEHHLQLLPWDAQRLATLTLTSGSSGQPKAAAHSYAAHLASAAAVLHLMDFQQQDRWLLSLPLFHVSGQGIVWRWLVAGAQLVVREMHPLAEALVGCSHASLVPTQLWRLLSAPIAEHTLKAVLLGGAMIPVALTQQAEAVGIRCWCGYGMTELASTVSAKRADEQPGVGLPLHGHQIRLVDQEILIRSPSMARGYWYRGALLPIVDEQGWFHTRDRAAIALDELRIIGRLDHQFFSGGEGIQPEDIERILAAHSQIRQVFIVPVDDIEFGQRPVAVIDSDETLTLDALRGWAEDKLANFQQPIALLAFPAEFKNSGIKISRHRLQQWAAKQFKKERSVGNVMK